MKSRPITLGFAPRTGAAQELTVRMSFGTAALRDIHFRSDGLPLRAEGAALLCLGLPLAQELGTHLIIDAPLSPETHATIPRITTLLSRWYGGGPPVPVSFAPGPARVDPPARATALFYSAGVDSSYSLAVDVARIDLLITLIGADIPASQPDRAEKLRHTAHQTAAAYGKSVVTVETDIRPVTDRLIKWTHYHGAVLAATAHLLSDHLNEVLIASSADEASWQRPWGSHPGLDPLWGNERLRVEHHALVPRFTKVAGIIDQAELMARLRVCDYDDANCGHCDDCRFMLLSLDILDGFDRAPTYRSNDRPQDLGQGSLVVDGYGTRTDMLDLRRAAASRGDREELVAAIDNGVRRFERRMARERLLKISWLLRRFKQAKRRYRYRRAATSEGDSRRP